jgi:hypothetical protein
MKKAIKHNLLLLKNMPLSMIALLLFLIGVSIIQGKGFFIIIVPTVTFFSILTMESFDGKKYNTLFSIPITRTEFAKAKFYTLLILNGAVVLFILALYFVCVHAGIAKLNILSLVLELAITLPLSIFVGGVLFGIKVDYIASITLLYILIANLFVINVNTVDVELQIGKDIILDSLVLIMWSGLSIASYMGSKRIIFNKYIDMEL